MKYEVRFEADGGVVRVRLTGDWQFAAALQMLESIVAACRREPARRVLLDTTNAEGALSTVDQLELAASMASARPAITFAILCTPGQATAQRGLETFAINRGGRVRIMTDPDEALRWLTARLESEPGRMVG